MGESIVFSTFSGLIDENVAGHRSRDVNTNPDDVLPGNAIN